MSFLDALMNWDDSLDKGREIVRLPRTWRSYLPWHNQPSSYRVHQTRAGLSVILPHKKNGELFRNYPAKKFEEIINWGNNHGLSSGFHLQETFAKSEEGSLFLGSRVTKAAFDQETRIGATVSLSYFTNQEGVLHCLRIYYGMVMQKQHFRNVSFDVFRNKVGRVYAKGPQIDTNIAFPQKDSWLIDYDATLENVVSLILPKTLGPEQLFPLLTCDYVRQHTLH